VDIGCWTGVTLLPQLLNNFMSFMQYTGHVWGKNKVTFDSWDAEIVFRVNGRGRIGADGLVSYFLVIYPISLC